MGDPGCRLQVSSLRFGVSLHPSTSPVALYLLAASAGLAVLLLLLALIDARPALAAMAPGAGIGSGFATSTMATVARRQWERRDL